MTTRVPCSKCGVSIHPDTAQKTGGLCMPCSGAVRPRTSTRGEDFREAFASQLDSVMQRRSVEEATLESADWIGRTGLDEATERELPRYLRREFGEFIDEPDALRASDLQYLGVFADDRGAAHFWQVPSKAAQEAYFAYVEVDAKGRPTLLGWGDRAPPPSSAA
jgi:hypothetical protein